MALVIAGLPCSSSATVTTVKVRLARTGNKNQSAWLAWLSLLVHMPLGGNSRGLCSAAIALCAPPAAESAIGTSSVCAEPAVIAFTASVGIVPEGAGVPSTYGPTAFFWIYRGSIVSKVI